MKRILFIGMVLVCFGCLMVASADAQQKDGSAVVKQMSTELREEAGFLPEEIRPLKDSLRNMLDKDATKEDLKKVLLELHKNGVKKEELKKSVDLMNELVNDGEKPKDAGNVVSRAVHQAQAQGLKGKDLAARVHEAIKQRKIQRQQWRTKMQKLEQIRQRMLPAKQEPAQKETKEQGKGIKKGKK